jgi:uncharacterized membrane protein
MRSGSWSADDISPQSSGARRAAGVLKPGTAALVVFVSKATPGKALAALAPLGGEVLRTSLSEDAEKEIQHALDAQGNAEAEATA